MKKTFFTTAALFAASSLVTESAMADEGMWQPYQLPKLSKELRQAGLKVSPKKLTELTDFPMGAVISLGGCTASFVSPQGLVVTNHHCAYGSIQFNSTAENNLIEKGFLAKDFSQELPAAPGSRVFVTEEVTNVTAQINHGIADDLSGSALYKAIEDKEKALIEKCEQADGYRCNVYAFHGGLEFFLIKQMEIKDVRLAYAPSSHIGKYGGDVDNWMWPRHTGDFAFYRAYVGKDGKPADFSKENVPYQPKHHLKVNADGVKEGDFIMVTGYPGRTNRYRSSIEVENQFEWFYPSFRKILQKSIGIIEKTAPEGSDARVKYASSLAGLNNAEKNWGSLINSYGKGDLLERKQQLEKDLSKWLDANPAMQAKHGDSLTALHKLIQEDSKNRDQKIRDFAIQRDALSAIANKLYRLSIEKQKPDSEREPGFQDRDLTRIKESMKRFDRRWDKGVAKALSLYYVSLYAKLPKDLRVASFDRYMELDKGFDAKKFAKKLDKMLAKTALTDQATRLAWMDKSAADFKKSADPYIQLAVATYDDRYKIEQQDKDKAGRYQNLRPKYMAALIDYYQAKNKPVYADANSTLRVTYGNVIGYYPQDGLYATPFTTLEGLAAKHTGKEPFISPDKQLELIKAKSYGKYLDKKLNSVQVNFLGNLDITGGNSGSPTLNAKAEFVGLVFDGVYESIIGDWDFNPPLNRSIHVSSAYMLWVMEYIDGADNLIKEMTVVR